MSLCIATPTTEEGEDEGSQGRRTRTGEIEVGGGGEPSLGWDHLRRLLCLEIMRAHKAVLGGGQGHRWGGAQHQESEQRGKWSWRVCQGSATYCTTNPATLHTSLKLPPFAHVSQDTSIPPPCRLSHTVKTASDVAVVRSYVLVPYLFSFKYYC